MFKQRLYASVAAQSTKKRLGIALLLSIVIGIAGFTLSEKIMYGLAQNQFEQDTQNIQEQIENNLNRYKDLLLSLRNLMTSHVREDKQNRFNQYASSLVLQEKYPALFMMDYSEPVSQKDIDSYYINLAEENARFDNNLYTSKMQKTIDINKNSLTNKDVVYLIRYVYPLSEAYMYIGQDIAVTPTSVRGLNAAVKSTVPIFSGRISYSKTSEAFPFITLRMAIVPNKLGTYKETGTVGVSVKLDQNLFASTNHKSYIDFQIYTPEEDGKSLIYDSRYRRESVYNPWLKELFNESRNVLTSQTNFTIGSRTFLIKTFSSRYPDNTINTSLSWAVGLLSFLITFVVLYFGISKRMDQQKRYNLIKAHSKNLEKEVKTDLLTGLPNRRAYYEKMEKLIKQYPDKQMAVCFIDLDGFKRINDVLGHTYGDNVLKDYASRLYALTQELVAQVYRVGGDEFVVVIEQEKTHYTEKNIHTLIQRVQQITDEAFNINAEAYFLSQSIGVAFYDEHGKTADELLRHSDIAMYEAKRNGKNRFTFYNPKQLLEREQRSVMLNEFSTALDKKEFYLTYQPKMKHTTRGYEMVGVEVLLRWKNARLGEVSPYTFIPLAEECGFIVNLGNWIIHEVCMNILEWREQGLKSMTVSINLSTRQLLDEALPYVYEQILNYYDISPSNIILEVTESAMMLNPHKTQEILQRFRNIGFGISIDDFGTGFSSLNYLHTLPVTEIKIDKSFTDNILQNNSANIIVNTIVELSRRLNLSIVIEGVEDLSQVAWIEQNYGADIILQGYHFSRPVSAIEIEKISLKGEIDGTSI